MNKIKKTDKLDFLILGICSIVIGIILFALSINQIIKLFTIIIGISAIIISIKPLILSIKNIKFTQNYFVLITSIVLFIFGVMMLISPNKFILSLIIIYLLVIPLWNIITSPSPKVVFYHELPKIVFGLLFLLIGFEWLVSVVVYIIASLLIIIGIYNCIYYFKK